MDSLRKIGKAEDFEWLGYSELESKLQPRYYQSVRSFLLSPAKTDHQHLLDRALSSVRHQKQGITPEIESSKLTGAINA